MVPVKVEVWALGFRLSVAGFLLQVSSKCEYILLMLLLAFYMTCTSLSGLWVWGLGF